MRTNFRMKRTSGDRGFTLIELLVVIAVIGVLASVVLAALNQARDKGKVAKIQQQMAAMRTQAEIYKSNNGGSFYTNATLNVCTSGGVAKGGIYDMLSDTAKVFNSTDTVNTTLTTAQTVGGVGTRTICHAAANGQTWAASTPTNAGTATGYWCVDSSGASKLESPASNASLRLGANVTSCP